MLERVVESYLVKRVKQLCGEIRKLKYIGRKGAPDRLILLPGNHFLIETKRPGKDAKDHQEREHVILRWAGFKVYVADTQEDVDKILEKETSK